MSSVNVRKNNQDRTVRIFDNFYNFDITVDVNSYDVVLSFFKSVFGNNVAAENFTLNFFEVVRTSGKTVQELLQEISGQNQISLTATFSLYLNNLRSNSTLLGISNPVTPNFYAARNVLS